MRRDSSCFGRDLAEKGVNSGGWPRVGFRRGEGKAHDVRSQRSNTSAKGPTFAFPQLPIECGPFLGIRTHHLHYIEPEPSGRAYPCGPEIFCGQTPVAPSIMAGLQNEASAGAKTEILEVPRYDVSIYDTPFSELPESKRVWMGSPSSTLEGLGWCSRCRI